MISVTQLNRIQLIWSSLKNASTTTMTQEMPPTQDPKILLTLTNLSGKLWTNKDSLLSKHSKSMPTIKALLIPKCSKCSWLMSSKSIWTPIRLIKLSENAAITATRWACRNWESVSIPIHPSQQTLTLMLRKLSMVLSRLWETIILMLKGSSRSSILMETNRLTLRSLPRLLVIWIRICRGIKSCKFSDLSTKQTMVLSLETNSLESSKMRTRLLTRCYNILNRSLLEVVLDQREPLITLTAERTAESTRRSSQTFSNILIILSLKMILITCLERSTKTWVASSLKENLLDTLLMTDKAIKISSQTLFCKISRERWVLWPSKTYSNSMSSQIEIATGESPAKNLLILLERLTLMSNNKMLTLCLSWWIAMVMDILAKMSLWGTLVSKIWMRDPRIALFLPVVVATIDKALLVSSDSKPLKRLNGLRTIMKKLTFCWRLERAILKRNSMKSWWIRMPLRESWNHLVWVSVSRRWANLLIASLIITTIIRLIPRCLVNVWTIIQGTHQSQMIFIRINMSVRFAHRSMKIWLIIVATSTKPLAILTELVISPAPNSISTTSLSMNLEWTIPTPSRSSSNTYQTTAATSNFASSNKLSNPHPTKAQWQAEASTTREATN